jgi:lipopolysaccharide heptosyltransferase III
VPGVLEALPRGGRVAVIRLRSLGDCVLTTPALDILKRFRPDARLSVIVEDRFRALFEGNPDVDEILPPGLLRLRRARPQLCLNLHGGPRSAWMTAWSGARWRAGFSHFRNQFAYNLRIPRAQEILGVERQVHTAEHLASAVFYLGAPRCEVPRAKLVAAKRAVPCAVIHPVAATLAKAWPADRFLQVARWLGASGTEVVIIGSAADDLSPFRAFRTLSGAPLSAVQSLMASAVVFVGNDSGPAHMAAAFGVPSVVLFGASDPGVWGPWRTPCAVLTAPGNISDIRTEQVIEALERARRASQVRV